MKRRALLTAIGASVVGVAGCLDETADSDGRDGYVWKHDTPGRGMTVSNGHVFGREKFSTSDPTETEVAGGIFALDGETGDHRWTYGSIHPGYESYTTLRVEDAVYGSKMDDTGASWTSVVEFDGTERASEIDGELEAVVDGVAYLMDGQFDSVIRAVDTAMGDESWTHPGTSVRFDAAERGTPETAYVAGDELVALDRDDGRVQWRYEHDADRSRVEAVSDGVAYLSLDRGTVAAVADGEEQWRTEPVSSPTVHEITSDLVLVRTDSSAYAFDSTTGENRWSVEADAVRVHSDSVYVGEAGTLSALEVADGSEVWTVDIGVETVESMAVADDDPAVSEPSLFAQTPSELHTVTLDGELRRTRTPSENLHGFVVDRYVIVASDSGIYALE